MDGKIGGCLLRVAARQAGIGQFHREKKDLFHFPKKSLTNRRTSYILIELALGVLRPMRGTAMMREIARKR